MKTRKSIGHSILLVIAAIVLGVVVQVIGSVFSGLTGISAIEYIVGLLGFVIMGFCIYKWVLK